MNAGKEVLLFLGALGAFNGLILSGYFLFSSRKKHISTVFFIALLLMLSLRITKSIFATLDHSLPKIYLQIGLTACFFIGPFLYYFLRSALNPADPFPRSSKRNLALLAALIFIVGIVWSYPVYPILWNKYFIHLIYAEWFAYLVASGFALKNIWKKLFNKASQLTSTEIWLLAVFGSTALIFTFFQLALWMISFSLYLNGAVAFSFCVYLILFTLLHKKKSSDFFLPQTKLPAKKVNDEYVAALLDRLEKSMCEKKLYRNADLKLHELSKELNISGHQLSQVLTDNLGKNFTTYINEFRIREACEMIGSTQHLTLESIGYDVGFNSKSTFFAAFKKHTGKTPAAYQQKTRSDQKA
jgi:AraC-like DNA-binding protein